MMIMITLHVSDLRTGCVKYGSFKKKLDIIHHNQISKSINILHDDNLIVSMYLLEWFPNFS